MGENSWQKEKAHERDNKALTRVTKTVELAEEMISELKDRTIKNTQTKEEKEKKNKEK